MRSLRHPGRSGTEQASDRFRGLDTWSSRSFLEAMLSDQQQAIDAVARALDPIARAAETAVPRLRAGGRLALAGAGTSGRIAVQDGVELGPTFGWPAEQTVVLIAGGEPALMRASEGAEDDGASAVRAVDAAAIAEGDVLIGLAASGTTPFTVAAVGRARALGALTIGVANNPATPLLSSAELPVLLDTGPEAIAGSTRLKAGTAQKVMMNLWSSLVMTRLGRIYDGYMVDMRATNEKLARRAERMLVEIAGCDLRSARGALAACGGRVKPAVLVLRGMHPAAADALLEAAGGDLRAALTKTGAARGTRARRSAAPARPSLPAG